MVVRVCHQSRKRDEVNVIGNGLIGLEKREMMVVEDETLAFEKRFSLLSLDRLELAFEKGVLPLCFESS